MTILYSDVEPLSKDSSVKSYLSPATRILNENPGFYFPFVTYEQAVLLIVSRGKSLP